MHTTFRRIVGLVSLSCLAVACAPVTATVVETPAPKSSATPKVSKPKASPTTWSVDLPEGWAKEHAAKDPVKTGDVARVLVATKRFTAEGVDYDVRLNVIVGRIPPDQADDFSAGMVEAAGARDNARVLEAREFDFGDVSGHEWVEIRQLDSHTLLGLIGAAGAKGDLAALVVCGGDASAAEEYMEECMTLVESLRFK